MGGVSLWHWIVVAVVIMLLFGKGRFSAVASDMAKGIKSFKKGLAEDEDAPGTPPGAAASLPEREQA